MFFTPPKVKSLSRYAEFGTYLGHKDFLIMLSIAVFMHAVIIGIYALTPRPEVIRVPVRVLNIKLTGGKESVEMPGPVVAAPVITPVQPTPMPVTQPQQAVRHETHEPPPPPEPKAKPKRAVTDEHMRPTHHVERTPAPPSPAPANDMNISTPKKYVREGDLAAEAAEMQAAKKAATAAGAGDGAGAASSAMGKMDGAAVAARYEQVISAWIQRHRVYPTAALQQGLEGNAIVRMRIDRMGHVLYRAIDQSSGNAVIDQAVLSMVAESSPLPPVPQEYPEGSQLEFLVPVTFRLR